MIRLPSAKGIETFATATLAMCAITVTGVLLRREFSRPAAPSLKAVFVKGWQNYAVSDERLGSRDGPVKVVVFSDFECPFCRQLSTSLDRLVEKSPSKFDIIYRNFPLAQIHPYARSAAVAGKCAAAQGQFETFYHFVFAHQDSIGTLNWPAVASVIGVQDTSAFRICMSDSAQARPFRADSLAGEALKLTGTPTVIVNGWKVNGSPPESQLEELVARALKLEEADKDN